MVVKSPRWPDSHLCVQISADVFHTMFTGVKLCR